MKRLAAEARAQGRELIVSEGRHHTKVSIGEAQTVVPRHNEINEITARAILRQMGVER
jgi:mRNA interferase HicA